MSFDIVNMFPTIDNNRGVAAVKSAPDSRTISSSSTECAIEALEICLCLIQTNGTAMGAANSCSQSDLAIQLMDNAEIDVVRTVFQEFFLF